MKLYGSVALAVRLGLAALFVMPANVLAYGREGHELVGKIADANLSPAAKAQVKTLLEGDLTKSGTLSNRKTLAEVASWADEVRGTSEHRETWHFDNIQLCPASTKPRCADGDQCASAQLREQVKIMMDSSRPKVERNKALKWIVHLVGDVHQPLHAAENDDHGGNWVDVYPDFLPNFKYELPTSLHKTWDNHILTRMLADKPGYFTTSLTAADKAKWAKGSIEDWVLESGKLSGSVAYGNLQDGVYCAKEGNKGYEYWLDNAYYKKVEGTAGDQVKKAGIRLATLLNAALGGDGPSAQVLIQGPVTIAVARAETPLRDFSKGSYNSIATKLLLPHYQDTEPAEVYCGCTFDADKAIDLDTCEFDPAVARKDDTTRGARIEWEHVVPAAKLVETFGCSGRSACRENAAFIAAENDPNNLLPALGALNARRSNHPYFEVAGSPRVFGACDFETGKVTIGGKQVTAYEPPEGLKGDVARIAFYMQQRYGVKFSQDELTLFGKWSEKDPVSPMEKARAIYLREKVTGWTNTFVEK